MRTVRTEAGARKYGRSVGDRITVAHKPQTGTRRTGTRKPKSTDVDAQHSVYRAVFDSFSEDVAGLMHITGLSKDEVLSHLRALKKAGLVSPVGSEMGDWQTWMTYDDIDEDEADELFDQKVPGRRKKNEKALLDRIVTISMPGPVG